MIRIFLFCTMLSGSLMAVGQLNRTLDDCIREAIKSNLELRQIQVDNRVKTEDLRQSRLSLLPEVSGSLNSDKSFGRAIDPSNNEIVSTRLFQANVSLGASLVLFNGFVNLNKVQYSRMMAMKGLMAEQSLKNDIAFKVMNAYYDLCFARGQMLIARDLRDLDTINLEKARIMVEVGTKAETETTEIRARLAQDEFHLTQARNNVEKARTVLRQLLNISYDTPFDIAEEPALSEPADLLLMPLPDSVYKHAAAHLPQFREMEIDHGISKLDLKLAKGAILPSLRAQAGYGTGYYDSYRDTYGNPVDFQHQLGNNSYQYIGLNLNIPLFNGAQLNRNIRVARFGIDKAEALNDMKKQVFRAEIENVCLSLRSAVDEYRASVEQEKSTALNLELAEKKWEQGTGNLLELTDARNRSASAEAEILRTQLQFKLKKKTLDIYEGKTAW
ncbi:MAG: TolC family protein [Bacteroidetes bacterium]|nr:TolC family protein [Bacteroidota bacterium]